MDKWNRTPPSLLIRDVIPYVVAGLTVNQLLKNSTGSTPVRPSHYYFPYLCIMNYKAYIQSLNNFPVADWAVSALIGFRESQMDTILFEDIEEVPKSKFNIVVANIEDTNSYFNRFGIPPKQALNIPNELNTHNYLRRATRQCTMGFFREKHKGILDAYGSIFIKPDGRAKEFIAGVMKKPETIECFKDVEDDCPILLSEVIDIVSEYRGYVYDNQLQGLYWYTGDFKIFPDVKIIDEMIDKYTTQPAGYSIDVGITKDGHTILIECNDGWSLGNYGLSPSKYKKLLTKRWIEIFKAY